MRKSSPVKERIYSGWKLYTSSDSLPMQIMAGVDTTLYASAHFTGEDHSSAIAKITFATGKTVQKSFGRSINTVGIDIPRGTVYGIDFDGKKLHIPCGGIVDLKSRCFKHNQ